MSHRDSLGEEIKKKKVHEDEDDFDEFDDEDDKDNEEHPSEEDDTSETPVSQTKTDSPGSEEDSVSGGAEDTYEKEQPTIETSQSEEGPPSTPQDVSQSSIGPDDTSQTPQTFSSTDEGVMIKHFVTQLQQVNNIIEGLLDELKTDELKGKPKKQKGKNKIHRHGNFDKTPKGRSICCITLKDKSPKPSENCLVCQLISLQDRIDTLIDKKLIFGDEEDLKELQKQQKILKDQLQKLIEKCDSDEISQSNNNKNKEKTGKDKKETTADEKKSGEGDEEDTSIKSDQGKPASPDKRDKKVTAAKVPPKGVFLNCVNELLVLIKSMNCISSPGTFWQKSITEPPKPIKRRRSKCCDRAYPHMHGDLNGVPVILKLYPSKKKQKEPEPEIVIKEEPEVQEEEEEPEIEEEPEKEPEITKVPSEPHEPSNFVLEDDVSTDSADSGEEDEEEDEDDDAENEERESVDYAINDLQTRSVDNGMPPSPKGSDETTRERKEGDRQPYSHQVGKKGSYEDRPQVSSAGKGSKATANSRMSRSMKRSRQSGEIDKKDKDKDEGYEDDEDVLDQAHSKKPRPETSSVTRNTHEATLTLILDEQLTPFTTSSVVTDIKENKQKNRNTIHTYRVQRKKQNNLFIYNKQRCSQTPDSVNINNSCKKNMNGNDLMKNSKTKIQNYGKGDFMINDNLNPEMSNEYSVGKKIIIAGLTPEDILDSYFKNNNNLLFHIAPFKNDINAATPAPETKSISDNKDPASIFDENVNYTEDLEEHDKKQNLKGSQLDYFSYCRNTTYDKTEDNFVSSSTVFKTSSTAISNSDSHLSTESDSSYSFNSLMDTVLKSSNSNVLNVNNTNNAQIINELNKPANENDLINKNLKEENIICKEEVATHSSLSSCSIKLKVVGRKSKIEINMNSSHNIVKKEVNDENLQLNDCKYSAPKKENVLKKGSYTILCDQAIKSNMQYLDCPDDSKDNKDQIICQLQKQLISKSDNDQTSNDKTGNENKPNDSNDSNDSNGTSQVMPWNWKITKPDIRQLEMFLDMVNETQQILLAKCNNNNDGDNNHSQTNKTVNLSQENDDETSSDSLNEYESCDDTCDADFVDAVSTSSYDKLHQTTPTKMVNQNAVPKKHNVKKLLNRKLMKSNKMLNSFKENETYSKLYSYNKHFFNNDFVIKVSPDYLLLKKSKKLFQDDSTKKEICTDETMSVKLCPLDKAVFRYLRRRQYGFDNSIGDHKHTKSIPAQGLENDIVCANFNIVGTNTRKHKNNPFSFHKSERRKDHTHLNLFKDTSKTSIVYPKDKTCLERHLQKEEEHSTIISGESEMDHEDDTGADDALKYNKRYVDDDINAKSGENCATKRPRLVWADDIEEEGKVKKNLKDNLKIYSFISTTSDSNESSSTIIKTKCKRYRDVHSSRPKAKCLNLNSIKENKLPIDCINHQKEDESSLMWPKSRKHCSRPFDRKEKDNYSMSSQSSGYFQSDNSSNADLVKCVTFCDESLSQDSLDLSLKKLIEDEGEDKSGSSSVVSLHKSILKTKQSNILKKQNSKMFDSASSNELSLLNNAIKADLRNSKDNSESESINLKNKSTQQKSVTFTIPMEHEQKILSNILQTETLGKPKKIRTKHVRTLDNNSNEKQIDNNDIENSNDNNEIKQKLLRKFHHAQYHLFPMSLKFAEFISTQNQLLQKISRPPLLKHQQLFINRLHIMRSIKFINIPVSHNLISNKILIPTRTSHCYRGIKKIRFSSKQLIELKGYIIKLEVCNILQYLVPICMNIKNAQTNNKIKKIFLREIKSAKINNKTQFLQNKDNIKKNELNNRPTTGFLPADCKKSVTDHKKSSRTLRIESLSPIKSSSECNKIHDANEFLNYVKDIRGKCLGKVDTKCSEENFENINSKILFNVSARPNTIFSITAEDGCMVTRKPESLPDLQNYEKSNLIKSSYDVNVRPSSAISGIKSNISHNEFRNGSLPDEFINSEFMEKNLFNDDPMLQIKKEKESTISIRLTGDFGNESDVNGKKKIKVIGRIIEPDPAINKMEFIPENLPLYQHNIEDGNNSSDTYSVVIQPKHQIKKNKAKKINKISSKQNQQKKIEKENKEEILNRRRNILLSKNNFTRPCPFNFDTRKKPVQVNRNYKNIPLDSRPPFAPFVGKHYLNHWEKNINYQKKSLPETISDAKYKKPLFRRPHSCCEQNRQINSLVSQDTKTKGNAESHEYGNNTKEVRKYSKSLDAINLQQKAELNKKKLSEVMILNDNIFSMKNSFMKTIMDAKKRKEEFDAKENESILQKNSIEKKQYARKNSKSAERSQTCDKKSIDTCRPSDSHFLQNQTSLMKIPSPTKIPNSSASDLSVTTDDESVEKKNNEFESLDDAEVICPVREHNADDSNSERSNSSISKLKKEMEYMVGMKSKIKTTFPETAVVKKKLLKRVCSLRSNSRIKPVFPSNDLDECDCFGAPLKDDLDISYYNEHGKPIVNIYGCKLYDKNGIPKRGAYGKPIHYGLREKLNIALKDVQITNQQIMRNENFEEDLLIVLNKYNGLKTDLFGRVYDGYGRPLFDRYGYLQYDINGNPLTDAYNRAFLDENKKPLITQTICNYTNFKTKHSPTNLFQSELQQNDKFLQKSTLSKLTSEHIMRQPSSTIIEAKIKNQFSFDGRSTIHDRNSEELCNDKSNSNSSSKENSDDSLRIENNNFH